jgi:hypothetical protein
MLHLGYLVEDHLAGECLEWHEERQFKFESIFYMEWNCGRDSE